MPEQQLQQTTNPPTDKQAKPKKERKNKGLVIAIIILIILLLAAIGWVVYLQCFKTETEPVEQDTTPTDEQADEADEEEEEEVSEEPEEPADPYEGWQTYTNTVHDYTLKYPADWTFNKSTAEETDMNFGSASLTIEKDYYTFGFDIMLGGIGGSVCMFDGATCPQNIGYGCTEMGDSVTVASEMDGTYKRNETGLPDVGQQVSFYVCMGPGQEYSRFVSIHGAASTVQYVTPTNPDADMLETLDMIFATLEEI